MLAVQGTVPYLGTFLTDLTMVDTAFRDTTDDGLINFDKRRREFEILTQIKLFQSAASLYHITPDANFSAWLQNIPTYDDKERLALLL
jgi:ral guanine nucleotide dissociation stimulator-like 1